MERTSGKVLGAAAGAAAGTVVLAVWLHQRRQRRQLLLQQQECATPEAAQPASASIGISISTLQQFQELQQRSSLMALLAPPVLSISVTQQGVKIAAIPPAVLALRQLEDLDLSGNALMDVPASIGGLTALTRLKLSDNMISELPPQIGKLQVHTPAPAAAASAVCPCAATAAIACARNGCEDTPALLLRTHVAPESSAPTARPVCSSRPKQPRLHT